MQAFKVRDFLAVLTLGLPLLASNAFAADAGVNSNPESATIPPLTAIVKLAGGPDDLPTYQTFVDAGTNKLGFLLPKDFHLAAPDPTKVTLVSADYNSIITWRIVAPSPTNATELDTAEYKALLLQRHPGGKILSEFPLMVGGHYSPAFEIRWSGPGGLERQEFAVFVLCPIGVVEFNLVSSLEKYGSARQELNTALLTFRWNDEHGKLVLPVYSKRI